MSGDQYQQYSSTPYLIQHAAVATGGYLQPRLGGGGARGFGGTTAVQRERKRESKVLLLLLSSSASWLDFAEQFQVRQSGRSLPTPSFLLLSCHARATCCMRCCYCYYTNVEYLFYPATLVMRVGYISTTAVPGMIWSYVRGHWL